MAQLRKVYPGYTVQKYAATHYSDDATFVSQRARIVEGLRKSGAAGRGEIVVAAQGR